MTDFIDLKDSLIKMFLPTLLQDKTTKKNIMFATDSYEDLGSMYKADMEIKAELLMDMDLKPRILKSQKEQSLRTRKKAEVFTPAWLCCKMNNHCDDEWFGRTDVFNSLIEEQWTSTAGFIEFPKRKTWKKYVDSRRIEITCGEAPYIVSRYDAATGQGIEIKNRIGILDRKLRIVNENTEDIDEWLKWTLRAFQSVYGYEWQGDSLLIARINLLMTFMEYYKARWDFSLSDKTFSRIASKIANVIAWNFWQMDGLTGAVPHNMATDSPKQPSFFDSKRIYCRIYDWRSNRSMTYNSLKKG